MDSIYKKLAGKLDEIPNGFPATESGVELEILAELFTPHQARLACSLDLKPQSADAIAEKQGLNRHEVFTELKAMYKKGLIDLERGTDGLMFKILPFIVGFYEHQNGDISRPFAHLFEQYYKEALHKIMNRKPPLHRIIPVEEAVTLSIEILPVQKGTAYLEEAQSWGVLPCICRVQQSLVGKDCGHTKENCLLISPKANAFKRATQIRDITLEEAKRILRDAAREGLIHSVSNVQKGVTYICNCCTCSCGIMRGVAEFGYLNSVASSDFLAEIDEERCTGCGECVKRCQFKALSLVENICRVESAYCYGCGQCVLACQFEAVTLWQKADSLRTIPPGDERSWREERTKNRKSEINSSEIPK